MKIDNGATELLNYYNSLPSKIKTQLDASNANVSTLGELMLIAEHYNQKQEVPNEFRQQEL